MWLMCVRVRLQQGKYVQRAAPGADAQVTGNLFTSPRASDEQPSMHVCVCLKNPGRHQELLTKTRNEGTEEIPSPK